jgi:hypothetical protein
MRNFIDLFNDTQTVSPTPASQPSSLLLMEQQALLEGKHFEAMFSTLEALGQRYHEDMILEKVAAAKEAIRLLRKSDRQAWAARIIRLWLFDRIAGWSVSDFNGSIGIYDQHDDATKVQKTEQYHAFIGEVKRLQAKYQGEYQKIMGEPYVASNDDPTGIIKRKIIFHFLGMPYSKIQAYQFGSKSLPVVLQELEALEDEFKTRTKSALTLHEGDEIILKMDNKMCWVMLGRGYCSEEANAMGHCGNAGARSGDRILSLRRFKDNVDGTDYYEVFLTFILQHDGFLGEMKGRANEKPAERYHPYIVALLKLPIIKGIRGGGYAPANNFSMKDLKDEDRDALIDAHPHLGDFEARLKKQGDSPELRAAILASIKEHLPSWANSAKWDDEADALVLVEFKDIADMVSDLTDDKTANALASSDGDRLFDYDFNSASDTDVESLLDSLPMQALIGLANKATEIAKAELDEEDFEDFDPSDTGALTRFLEEYAQDIYHSIKGAVISGMESGAESDAHESLVKEIKDLKVKHGHLVFKTFKNSKGEDAWVWDSPVKVVCSVKEACAVADAAMVGNDDEYEYSDASEIGPFLFGSDEGEAIFKVEEPYYGWSGFDDDYAISCVLDEVDVGEMAKAPEVDFDTMPLDDVKQWLRDMYERIPDGFVRTVQVDELPEERIRAAATGLLKTYYG